MAFRAKFLALAALSLALSCGDAAANDKLVRLSAPPDLIESGLLKYILPRFSLKTGVKVEIDGAQPDLTLGEIGEPQGDEVPVIAALDGPTYAAVLTNGSVAGSAAARKLLDWLVSDVGRRAIASYERDGAAPFVPPSEEVEVAASAAPTGDTTLGEDVSLRHCGRCHVVNDKNKFGGIGSTPSFGALRTLPEWSDRFEAFWTLNPHPSFTQVKGVTEPFAPSRPPPIAPVELTMDEVDAIVAFVTAMKPKDLGAPLVTQ